MEQNTKLGLIENNFEGQEVRVIVENGQTWFVAKDVCDILGLDDTSKAVSRLDDDEKLTRILFVSGQNREMNIINESGLYSLILTSRKSTAKRFRKWVTAEILPSIRKHGGYINPNDSRDPIDIAENLVKIAKAQREVINQQQAEITELKPKAEYVDQQLIPDGGSCNLSDFAKQLNFKFPDGKKLYKGNINRLLKDEIEGFKGFKCLTNNNLPLQKYINNGWFKIKEYKGNTKYNPTAIITALGRTELFKIFTELGLKPVENLA